MAAKKVFVSFDYDNDKQYRYLLNAWSSNLDFAFKIEDHTSGEIKSKQFSVVKAGLSRKINEADYLVVIIGSHTNSYHSDWLNIGEKRNREILQCHLRP